MPANAQGRRNTTVKPAATPTRRSDRLLVEGSAPVESSPLTSLPSRTEGGRTPRKNTRGGLLRSNNPLGKIAAIPKHVSWEAPTPDKPRARFTTRQVIASDQDDEDEEEADEEESEDEDVLHLLDKQAKQDINDHRADGDYNDSDFEEVSFKAALRRLNNDDSSPIAERGNPSASVKARGYIRSSSVPALPVTPTPNKARRKAASQQGSPTPEPTNGIPTAFRGVFPMVSEETPRDMRATLESRPRHDAVGEGSSHLPENPYAQALAQTKYPASSHSNRQNGGGSSRQKLSHQPEIGQYEPSHTNLTRGSQSVTKSSNRPGQPNASVSHDPQSVTNDPAPRRSGQSNASAGRDSQSVGKQSTSRRSGQSNASVGRDPQSITNEPVPRRSGQSNASASRDSQSVTNEPAPRRSGQSNASASRDSQSVANEPVPRRSGQSNASVGRDPQSITNEPVPRRSGQSNASAGRDSQSVAKQSMSNRSAPSNTHGSRRQQLIRYEPARSESPPLRTNHKSKKRAVSPGNNVDIDDERGPKRRKIPDAKTLQLARRQQGDYSDEGEHQTASSDGGGSDNEDGVVARAGRSVKEARPRSLGFYDGVTAVILKDARKRFMLHLATDDAYPCGNDLDKLVKTAFDKACKKYPAEYENSTVRTVNQSIRTMLIEAGHEFRGRVHTAAKGLVLRSYELLPKDGGPVSRQVIAGIVEGLLTNYNYVMGPYLTSKGKKIPKEFYCHPAIGDVILQVFFRTRPTGTTLRKLSPIPYQLIAFVCAALKCALEEWETGSFKKISFTQTAYRDTYVWHRAWWQRLEAATPNTCSNISKNVSDYCLSLAGMKTSSDDGVEAETENQLAELMENEPQIPGWCLRDDDDIVDD